MNKILNDNFLRALRREKVDHTPVWIMRQAGRYLPEYRAVRKKIPDFLTLCKNPELACEVTLQPLERFNLDASIVFSDILTIPDAMGLGLYFEEGEGPKFKNPIKNLADIAKLQTLKVADNLEKLTYVFDSVALVKKNLKNKIPLIGFSGSPWTLATYMIEGGSSRDFRFTKSMLYKNPEDLKLLLNILADNVAEYLIEQSKAGADALQIFDTWGGALAHYEYLDFSLFYIKKIIAKIKAYDSNIPIITFTKNGGLWLEQIADSGADCLGLDWTMSIKKARDQIGHKVALQGNLDPAVLYSDEQTIEREVKRVLDDFGPYNGHIFNLGHGVTPFVEPDKVKFLVDLVHNYCNY